MRYSLEPLFNPKKCSFNHEGHEENNTVDILFYPVFVVFVIFVVRQLMDELDWNYLKSQIQNIYG